MFAIESLSPHISRVASLCVVLAWFEYFLRGIQRSRIEDMFWKFAPPAYNVVVSGTGSAEVCDVSMQSQNKFVIPVSLAGPPARA